MNTSILNNGLPTSFASAPKLLMSKAGHTFDLDSDTWKLSKDISVVMSSLLSEAGQDLKEGVKKVMAYYAQNYSAGQTKSFSVALHHFFRNSSSIEISDVTLINYRGLSKTSLTNISRLRPFFRRWYKFGYKGVSREVVDMLDSWRIPGGARGEAVKRLDPKEGPLSDLELEAFNEGAVAAFERDEIGIEQLAVSLLTSSTGRRPIQISHLKHCDLWSVTPAEGGDDRYFINIPRAKQGLAFRAEFKTFEITHELWCILSAQKESVRRWYVSNGGEDLDEITKLLPIFPGRRILVNAIGMSSFKSDLGTDKFHMLSGYVTRMMKAVSESAGVHSHRTDEELHVFARRFRYTIGTRAAREGLNKYVIAELLDHSDIQHVDTYTLNVPEHVKRIDEAVAYQLFPIAQAFAGVLVDNEEDALRGHDPNSRVRDSKISCGTCGHFGFCGALAPISCYTCIHFQAWLEAPHEELLSDLIAERDQIIATTGDLTIAAIKDRTIFAVAEVVKRCAVRRAEMEKEGQSDE